MEPIYFRDSDDAIFAVAPLTREAAEHHADRLLELHNQIPFQHWTRAELLADADERRTFTGKWEISRMAVDPAGAPVGFCIGFELVPDGVHYHEPAVYMHRMAVAPEFRKRWVGALLHVETLRSAFGYGRRRITAREPAVYGQTNDVPENRWIIRFYLDAGFTVAGRKAYHDREDLIMRMTYPQFLAARHTALAQERRVLMSR